MKVCSYRSADNSIRTGIIDGDEVLDGGTRLWDPLYGPVIGKLDEVHLVAPVPAPAKIVCVGRNYADHAAETGSAVPKEPQLFAKWSNAVVGDGVDVILPPITNALDYEAELVVVIGRTARRVAEEHALRHVFGYTCGNDISARDLQFGDTQWIRGKALDTFAPMGPWIVTADEIPDPQVLGIRSVVNGETRQDDTTANMIFSVARIIAFISEAITLNLGDVIYTGTPAGVGHGRKPPTYLKDGDTVTVEIDRIGSITNRIVSIE